MAIITHSDGREDWIKEIYCVVSYERKAAYGEIIERTRQAVEVEAYSKMTAIDVAVDVHRICSPDQVKDRHWEVALA
jgi:hypothetical protein|tara:strand:+ start:27192 stop:27422 length:231 start_codon:yes stop_codon:yes gene_type:complete